MMWCVAANVGGAWLIFLDGLEFREASALVGMVRQAVPELAPCVMKADQARKNEAH